MERALSASLVSVASLTSASRRMDEPTASALAAAAVPAAAVAAAAVSATDAVIPTAAPEPVLDLRCLNGVRALSSLLVVLFHCYLALFVPLLPHATASVLARDHWFVRLSLVCGPLAVGVFLLLTAMLSAYQLIPLLEGSGSRPKGAAPPSPAAVAARYWRRRAARLLPAYGIALALAHALPLVPDSWLSAEARLTRDFAFRGCAAQPASSLLRNLLFATNADFTRSCATQYWSLALQVQFFLAFPMLLLALRPRAPAFRARLAAALAALAAAGVALRLANAWAAAPLRLPLGDLREPAEVASYVSLLQAAYFPSSTRLTELALGALLGLLLRTPAAVGWLLRRRVLLSAATVALQAAFAHSLRAWSTHGVPGEAAWSPLFARLLVALGYWGSPLAVAAVAATLLALVLHADPWHTAAAAAFRARVWEPLCERSYGLYLLHEQARFAVLLLLPAGALPALLRAAPAPGLAALAALNVAAALPAAHLLYKRVEVRFA